MVQIIRRDFLILIALFAILAIYVVLGPAQSSGESFSLSPTTHSSSPDGAMALLRWTDYLGYDAQRLEYQDFRIDEQARSLLILDPSVSFNRTQSDMVLQWVEEGGVLLLVEQRAGFVTATAAILDALDLELRTAIQNDGVDDFGIIEQAPVILPIFNDPPVRSVQVRTDTVIVTEREDVVPLVGTLERPIMLGMAYGDGYIYVSSAIYPFTNEGLRNEENAALVLNLLRRMPSDGRVLFDEYHHGFFEPPSLRTLLLNNAWGQAIIYSIVLTVLYLILTGRRFGKPIPLREEIARRSSGEYVESMADLFQRGGQSAYIFRHYASAIRRRLIRPYGLAPDLADADLIAALSHEHPADANRIANLLQRLHRTNARDTEMLQLLKEADALLQEQKR